MLNAVSFKIVYLGACGFGIRGDGHKGGKIETILRAVRETFVLIKSNKKYRFEVNKYRAHGTVDVEISISKDYYVHIRVNVIV